MNLTKPVPSLLLLALLWLADKRYGKCCNRSIFHNHQ